MTKLLYGVEITVYVMAEDEDEAKSLAVTNCEEDNAEAWQAFSSVASEWSNAIPFGADDNMTCGDILKLQRARSTPVGMPASKHNSIQENT